MFYDEGVNSCDIGSLQQSAWNDGFRDGMDTIERLIHDFKKQKYLKDHEYIMALRELQLYIEKNKPRRNKYD